MATMDLSKLISTKKIVTKANFKNFIKSITIEPAILLFSLALGFYYIAGSQLYVDKMCRVNLVVEGLIDLNESKSTCDNIYNNKDLQIKNQERVTVLQTTSKCIQSIPPLIYALFAGPWCDRNGRKPLILISLFGYILCQAVFLINTIWYHELKAEYLLLESIQGNLFFIYN